MNKNVWLCGVFCLWVLIVSACGAAPTEDTEWFEPGTEIVAPELEGGTGGPVAILVVDDFQLASITADKPPEGNCAVTSAGQGVYVASGMGVYVASGMGVYVASGMGDTPILIEDIPHGGLVMSKFWQLLGPPADTINPDQLAADAAAGNEALANFLQQGQTGSIGVWNRGGYNLYVVGVDTARLNTDVIAQRITAAIKAMQERFGVERFVVNMSFAIVPCDLSYALEDYLEMISEAGLDDLRVRLENMIGYEEAIPVLASYVALRHLFTTPDNSPNYWSALGSTMDPVQALFQDPPLDQENIIGVAAAGNFAQPFPYAPALWPHVLSVSVDAPYSNAGEVMMFDGTVNYDGMTLAPATSWAAPEMSLNAADHLLWGGSAICDGLRPPLAYATDPTRPNIWENLSFDMAKSSYCPSFLP